MKQYHIDRQDGPDYYPLTTQEVIELLETAIGLLDHKEVHVEKTLRGLASIQQRLGQGIPGKTSPQPLYGPVTAKLMYLNEAYMKWLEDPDTLFFKEQPLTESSDIVVTLMNLMR